MIYFLGLLTTCFTETQSVPLTNRSSRAPCRTFLWDAPSAARHHICKRLLRGRVYEGMGGKKFVRIKPNSVLEKLYPPSRHGPDRCLVCGYSFDNHLKAWWFPHLYSPFDQHLDAMYKTYTVDPNPNPDQTLSKKTRKNLNKSLKKAATSALSSGNNAVNDAQKESESESIDPGMRPMYNDSKQSFRIREFHKRYVEDISKISVVKKKWTRNRRDMRSTGIVSVKMQPANGDRKRKIADAQMEKRKQKQALEPKYESRRIFNVKYRVPCFNIEGHTLGSALLLGVTRPLVLERLDGLLWLQDRERRWYEWKKQREI
mmetsp:Transcript_14104/g.21143  ORF Transcript_14104/g.21143 Transcript_14104/m.21143 type:complete len:316 (-) Transcript_14104:330-1277(-)